MPRARVGLLLTAMVCLFFRLGELALVEPSEGRYAEIGREMLESGDWVTPHLNYQRHLEKPPFAYWMIALGIRAWDADNFGARFMATVFGTLLVLLVFEIGAWLYDALAGLLAGLVLLAHPLFFVVVRSATADVFVTAWGAAAVWAFLRWYDAPTRPVSWRLVYWLCLGVGMLTKGPVVFVHGLLPVVVFLGLRREWGVLRRLGFMSGLPLSLIFIVPWMLLLERGTPGAFEYLVLRKATGALTSSAGYHDEPLWYYVPGLLFGCMPWSFFLPAFWSTELRPKVEPDFNPRTAQSLSRGRDVVAGGEVGDLEKPPVGGTAIGAGHLAEARRRWAALFLFGWWPALFLVFTASAAKLMTYLLPITIPIALMNGRLFAEILRRPEARLPLPVVVAAYAWLVLIAVLTLAAPVFLLLPQEGLMAGAHGVLPLVFLAGAAYLTSIAAVRSPARRGWVPLLTVAFLLVLFQIGISGRKATEVQYSSVEPIGRHLQAHAAPGARVVCYRCFIRSIPFYARRRVYLVDYDKEDDVFDRQAPGFSDWVLFGQDQLLAMVKGPETVWVITKVKYLEASAELAAATRVVDRNGSVVLLTNR